MFGERKKRQKTIPHLHFLHCTARTVRRPITHAGAAVGGIAQIFSKPMKELHKYRQVSD